MAHRLCRNIAHSNCIAPVSRDKDTQKNDIIFFGLCSSAIVIMNSFYTFSIAQKHSGYHVLQVQHLTSTIRKSNTQTQTGHTLSYPHMTTRVVITGLTRCKRFSDFNMSSSCCKFVKYCTRCSMCVFFCSDPNNPSSSKLSEQGF